MATDLLTGTAAAQSAATATPNVFWRLVGEADAVAAMGLITPIVLNVLGEIGKTSVPFYNFAPEF